MPIYEYECPDCGNVQERLFGINDFPKNVPCMSCLGTAWKIISRVQDVKPDWEPYYDENLETMITGRKMRKDLMKARGLVEKPKDHTKERIMLQERRHKKREEAKYGR